MNALERLKRKSLLAAVAPSTRATAGTLLAVDQLHADWHTPAFIVRRPVVHTDYVWRSIRDNTARPGHVLGDGEWERLVLGVDLADPQAEPVLVQRYFDASRDTLLREPFASQLRPDLSTPQWKWETAAEILADLRAIASAFDLSTAKGARLDAVGELHGVRRFESVSVQAQPEKPDFAWSYGRLGGVSVARPMAVCLASFSDLGDDKFTRAEKVAAPLKATTLPPRGAMGKRGQKRNRRQRREARVRHAGTVKAQQERARMVREMCDLPERSDDVLDARVCEGVTIHAEDIPRVGERARERAERARFGGAW